MPEQADLRQYINELMVSTGGCASTGYPIASCKIYTEKSYAFLEFRSVEEASNCMAFDGVAFKDSYLRVCILSCVCVGACQPYIYRIGAIEGHGSMQHGQRGCIDVCLTCTSHGRSPACI